MVVIVFVPDAPEEATHGSVSITSEDSPVNTFFFFFFSLLSSNPFHITCEWSVPVSKQPALRHQSGQDSLCQPNVVYLMRPSESRQSMASSHRQSLAEVRIYAAMEAPPKQSHRDFKGRIRTWPGIMLLVVILGAAIVLITFAAIDKRQTAENRQSNHEKMLDRRHSIKDGKTNQGDIISDDGAVGNPKSYPPSNCQLPKYLSKNGGIVVAAENDTEVPISIKGINWSGMETGDAVPAGLYDNGENGTTAYQIAAFLARNKFNSVRLPVSISNILKNVKPRKEVVNIQTNRALNITNYMSLLKSVIETFAYRRITVLISLHTLTPTVSGGAWFNGDIPEEKFLEAVEILSKELCNSKYWNIIGLDLKNEPFDCSWGGAAPDWHKGATTIGNKMLEGCPNWLAFVEGISGSTKVTLDGQQTKVYNWYGSGLADAGASPVELKVKNKVVYAPHYYNTGVSPNAYLYDGGKANADKTFSGYKELPDDKLKDHVEATMDAMFGYLLKSKDQAVVMGEFGGLYAIDKHPFKTTKRTTDFTLDIMVRAGYAGGYVWTLNPESEYQFNPADTFGKFHEGILEDDWLTPNTEFLKGMEKMNDFPNVQPFPCFEASS